MRTLYGLWLLLLVQAAGCGCMENVLGLKDLPVNDFSSDDETAEFVDDGTVDDTEELKDSLAEDETEGEGCESSAACDDGEPCNGEEFCSIDRHCIAGTPRPDGEECAASPRSICLAGLCEVSICGDGYVDAGRGEQCDDANLTPGDGCENDCTYTCTAARQAEDCDDGIACTPDVCDEGTHICINPPDDGWCLIAGTCYEDGESNPLGWCQWCQSTVSSTAWTDKATQKLGNDERITSASGNSNSPSLVWAGSVFGVAWEDDRAGNDEIYFAIIDTSGGKIVSDTIITTGSELPWIPSLVWTGSEFGVAWSDERDDIDWEIYFTRVDSWGSKVGSDIRITSARENSIFSSLVWMGSEYGVAWEDCRDYNFEIYFARIDSSGSKMGSDVRITSDTGNSEEPSLVWTGSEFGVAWEDDRDGNEEIYFARIDYSGSKTGSDVRITNNSGDSVGPSLVWTGSEFGVAWQDYRDGDFEIYFARIDSSGSKIGGEVRITNASGSSSSPSLVWTGSEFGAAWWDNRDGNYDIYFVRIDSSGSKMGSDVRITSDSGDSGGPSLVWTGSEFGVAWEDDRDGIGDEIYFARIGCLP